MQHTLDSIDRTRELAAKLSVSLLPAILSRGLIVALDGELGSGKTTFAGFLCRYLGSYETCSSPTYVLENRYSGTNGIEIRHWDLYRLALEIVPEELLEPVRPAELRIIEWASRSVEVYKNSDINFKFQLLADGGRVVLIDNKTSIELF